MKELNTFAPESYETPAVLDIMPQTMIHGSSPDVSGTGESDDNTGGIDD